MTAPRSTAARKPAARKPAPKKPQDRLQKAQPAGPDKPFRFTTAAGESVLLPPVVDHLNQGFVRTNRDKPMGDQLFTLLEMILDDDDPNMVTLDGLQIEETREFMAAWAEHIGLDLGESQASATS